jgi:hypothetical protein
MDLSLAELLPLWRTLREQGVTALVTPALDYVGALQLTPTDVRFLKEDEVGGLGERLRSLLASLDDGTSLNFLYRVREGAAGDIREFVEHCRLAEPAELKAYVDARARWLGQQKVRRVELYLFFSEGADGKGALARGHVGLKLMFANLGRLTRDAHAKKLHGLSVLRDQLVARLSTCGVAARELLPAELTRLHRELLNPGSPRAAPTRAPVRDNLWSDSTIRRVGPHLAEVTEAEALVTEDLVEPLDATGYFRLGRRFRRALTLKVLPEDGTHYFDAEPLLSLSALSPKGERQPFGYWVSVAVNVQPQGPTKWRLSTQHGLVDALKNAIPFLTNTSIQKATEEAAKQGSIQALFTELQQLSSKLVTLSVSVLLDASSLDELDAQTEAAKSAFSAAGNSELYAEEVSQVPAFLSMFPGSGPYQLRRKACTSRNAGDFLPLFAPWRGTSKSASVLLTPEGQAFRFDLFDKEISNSHHGIVVGKTGSGKSMGLGALTLGALAAGTDAILVDNGNSWKPLTELFGGVHLPIDIKTSLCPFSSYEEMLDTSRPGSHGLELDLEAIEDVVNFLQVCVAEPGQPNSAFDKVTTDVVARAVREVYLKRFKDKPQERPLIGAFRDGLKEFGAHEQRDGHDKAICESVGRRLNLFTDGLYGDFLNRPSTLRFDARILTFDLAKVSKSPFTHSIAMATLIQAITNRAQKRGRRLLVEVDEGHELLANANAGAAFLAGCYRKMRKYDVWMWLITQHFTDFLRTEAGRDIVDNATLKIFLRRDAGHEPVIDYLGLSPRAAKAFRELDFKPGHYSDFLLMYGTKLSTVRLALDPLAYWILTTDPEDKKLLTRAEAKNLSLGRFELLQGMADAYPHGAPKGQPAQPAGRVAERPSQAGAAPRTAPRRAPSASRSTPASKGVAA